MSERKESKVLRHIVSFIQALDATGTFTKTIYCPFAPDEMKVISAALSSPTAAQVAGVFSLQCDSLTQTTGGNLAFLLDPVSLYPGIKYPLTRSPNGSHTFTIVGAGTPLVAVTTLDTVQMGIHLEFRKTV